MQFRHFKIVYKLDQDIFCGYLRQKKPLDNITPDQLQDVAPIPRDCYRPILPPSTTVVVPSPADSFFVKRPNFADYKEGSELDVALFRGTDVCEILRLHHHLNILTYLGCESSESRLDGICFKKYPESLEDKVDRRNFNKAMFLTSRQVATEKAVRYLQDIKAGIDHLHSLGYVHNNLNPRDITIAEDDTAVIIDFGSCVKVGAPAYKLARTYGCFRMPEKGEVADEKNDTDALKDLRTRLLGNSPDGFVFKEF